MAKHALLSASGSSRWLACPPSARLEEKFPPSTSVYAEEGTIAHEFCEVTASYWLGLMDETAYEDHVAKLSKSEYYSAEMQECANAYARFVLDTFREAQASCPDAFAVLEVRLDLSKYIRKGFGTGDCVIVADDTLIVIDYKHGKGVRVDAENNSQMRLYALGALDRYGLIYDIKNVRMAIFQPRITQEPSVATCSVDDLRAWATDVVIPRATLAYEGKGEFAPSESACRFCRAKAQCRARAEKLTKLFDEAPDTQLLTVEEAGDLLKRADDMQAWLSDLENLVSTTLLSGTSVPGWKMVEGRSNRKLADELKVVDRLKEAGIDEALLYERKLISLTQMERDFGKKAVSELLADLIVKPQGKPTLVPESDKRPAYIAAEQILNAFDD